MSDTQNPQRSPVHYHAGAFPPVADGFDWHVLLPHIGPATAAVARYDGILQAIPNSGVLLSPLSTREAVLSSRIEGTQASMTEVLEFEAGGRRRVAGAPGGHPRDPQLPPGDARGGAYAGDIPDVPPRHLQGPRGAPRQRARCREVAGGSTAASPTGSVPRVVASRRPASCRPPPPRSRTP